MKAMHGGKAKHDTLDAHTIAALLRGGLLPQASVDPAAMRATRDLLRRRTHLMHTRAELLAPVQQTTRQDNVPAIGTNIADKATRDGVAARMADPAGHKTIAIDLALLTYDDPRRGDLELSIMKAAQHQDAPTLYR